MAEPNITQEVFFEMLEKLPDGTFRIKFPKVKSKSGVTFDEHLAEIVSEIVHVTRDVAIEGQQIVTGFSKKIKSLDVIACVYNNVRQSIGHVSDNLQFAMFTDNDGKYNNVENYAIAIKTTSTTGYYTRGAIIIDDNKVIIDWSKTGGNSGGQGTAQIYLIAHYHGGV